MDSQPIISISHLGKTYASEEQPIKALEDLSFDVYDREFMSLVGPSGCGKSTILRIISGLVPLSEGTAKVRGTPIDRPPFGIGMVFQNPILLPWRRVIDNVLLPIQVLELKGEDFRLRAMELLKSVGLKGFEHRYPRELSGGMQQRVAICRALIHDPDILLMDEPFGALDAMTRDQMNIELLRIWETKKKTIVFVTHSIPEAVFLSDRVLLMSNRPGKVLEITKVDLPRPRTVRMRATQKFADYVAEIFAALGFSGWSKEDAQHG